MSHMQLPARIGKYELQEFLGGGMSHVYRAVDTLIGRTVAVKILTDAGCQDTQVKERFLAEARMAGSLSHDNVLGIYDFGEDDQHRPFMVMEFLRGEDLRHAIRNGHCGELQGKLKIAVQVARALQYVHSQKIVHRDLKPDNIHINAAGVVKLIDFGIAKTEGLQMTQAGFVLGTPFYMAPEQVTGENITEQVDVYAFGILLFELLTGKKPVHAEAVERIFYSILNEPLKLEPLYEACAPQSICDLIANCTAKNPAQRPQGFAPVIAELERVISEADAPTMMLPPATATVAVAPAPSGRPAWLLPAVLVLVIGLAAGIYFAVQPGPKPAPKTPEVAALAPTLALPSGDMVLVPAGEFKFGEKQELVSLPAFYIDKTEVTNAAYAEFCKQTQHALPKDFTAEKPDFPVVNVSILDAQAFVKWAQKRLPTAREWEKAARGVDGRLYPWGNQPELARANIGSGAMQSVAAFANGESPFHALNMVGNVWELVDQISTPQPAALQYFGTVLKPAPNADEPWYTIRGQSFGATEKLDPAVLFDSTTVPARWRDANIGFRCVKDAH